MTYEGPVQRYRIKVVPDDRPNAEGRWIEVDKPGDARAPYVGSWLLVVAFFRDDVPLGEHVVRYVTNDT